MPVSLVSFSPTILLAVALGGSIGALLRYFVSVWSAQRFGDAFPWGTLAVNLIGSLLIGLLVGWIASKNLAELWRSFLMVGLLGSLTTFSTFSLELLNFFQRGELITGVIYLLVSVVFGVGLAYLGYSLTVH